MSQRILMTVTEWEELVLKLLRKEAMVVQLVREAGISDQWRDALLQGRILGLEDRRGTDQERPHWELR